MNCLIIDCSAGMGVYLLKEDEVFSKVDDNQKKHTDELLLVVDELLINAKLTVKDLNVIAVCVGPGSFTGIRVACSICKGLTVESDVKIVAVSNFDIYQYGTVGDAVFVLDGFSEFVYVRELINDQIKDECVNIAEFAKKYLSEYSNVPVFVQNDKLKEKFNFLRVDAEIVKNNIIYCIKDKISKKMFTPINEINPVYLRASQAEIERNKKLGVSEN